MPILSIIVPVFNKEDYLEECLVSLCSQTWSDMEILCIDNNSSDGSLRILEAAAARDPRIIVLQEHRQGVSFARNTGLDHATGDFIGFVDADDYIEHNYFEKLLTAANINNAEIAFSGYNKYHPSEGVYDSISLPTHAPAFAPTDLSAELFWATTPSVCTKIFKRSLIETYCSRFDTSLVMAEDLLFSFGLISQAQKIAVIPEPLYHYRQETHGEKDDSKALSGVQVLDALEKLEAFLDSNNAGAFFTKGLLIYSIEETRFTLSVAHSFEAYKEIFNRFKKNWAPRISIIPEDEIANQIRSVWSLLKNANSAEECLYHSYLDQMAMRSQFERQYNKSRMECDMLHSELEQLKSSTTFRVGNMLMKVPRKVKRLLQS